MHRIQFKNLYHKMKYLKLYEQFRLFETKESSKYDIVLYPNDHNTICDGKTSDVVNIIKSNF